MCCGQLTNEPSEQMHGFGFKLLKMYDICWGFFYVEKRIALKKSTEICPLQGI